MYLSGDAKKTKILGVFQLVMINVIAVDSIRTLTFSAVFGFSLVFFYILAALFFFIPTALVSAELGTGWPNRGGIYVWVREAFGKRFSFFIIWLNWMYNIIWYPTILALIVGTFSYLYDPELANRPLYVCAGVLIIYWAITLINCLGMKASSIMSTIGAIIGTIAPMVLIIVLGFAYVMQGQPMNIEFSWDEFWPKDAQSNNLAFMTSVLFGLLGLEMAATHAAEMRNPTRDYPRSLLISAIIILGTIVFASLAIAIVVPTNELSLATGVMQAFTVFTDAFQMPWLLPLIAACIILGGLSGVGAWIIGPTKGLLVACQDGSLPASWGRTNKKGVPVTILLTQAIIVSVLSMAFLLFPSVNSSFWILSAMTAQLALICYIALFAAALKLHYTRPNVFRRFRVPGKKLGIWTVCLLGSLSCFVVILLGFLPPSEIPFQSLVAYEAILVGGMAIFCLVPYFLYAKRKRRLR
jgi:glutamate:GABA antiporter